MTTLIQVLTLVLSSAAFVWSLSRLVWIYSVRAKARRVLAKQARLYARIRSQDAEKADKAVVELRNLVKSNSSELGSEFSARERRAIKKALSDRVGARSFLSI